MPELLSTSDAAKLLGTTRITIFRKIKSGEIPAVKVGKKYLIKREDLDLPGQKIMSETKKKLIDQSVKRVVVEYGETLKLLKDA